MRRIDCKQGTDEWWEAKRGIPSASNFDKIITPKTGKLSASCHDLICELIADAHSLAPVSIESYTTKPMQHGIDTEPEARRWYEMDCNLDVEQVGFITTDDGRFGCSPDGLVGSEGGLELKCPTMKTHVSYLLAGGLPAEYKPQVHGSLIVTGRSWWDFVSYAHSFKPLTVRVTPDDYTEALRKALDEFWILYQIKLEEFRRLAA